MTHEPYGFILVGNACCAIEDGISAAQYGFSAEMFSALCACMMAEADGV